MIAKRGRPRNSAKKSGMTELVHYVANPDKAEIIRVTNCDAVEDHNVEVALAEMNATQWLNSRAKTDKTYHLIFSFREGERPSLEMLSEIEQHLCEKVGLGEHQRISAIHTDTDNLHVHVAINLVHPETGVKVTPYRDNIMLSEGAREMELKFNLERDNGMHYIASDRTIKRDPTRNRNERGFPTSEKSRAMEAYRGVESFQTWLSKEPANALRATLKNPDVTWQDVHETLDRYNLKLVVRGNGFAVADADNPTLRGKASEVGRFFSKNALEGKLGTFQQASSAQAGMAEHKLQEKQRYVERPTEAANIERRAKQHSLYKQFQASRSERDAGRRSALEAHRERISERFKELATDYRAKKEAIKNSNADPAEKKAAYKLASMERVLSEQRLRDDVARERAMLAVEFGGRSENYRQFVTRRAQDGDEAALAALRGMKPDTEERDRRAGDDTIRGVKAVDQADALYRVPMYRGQQVTHRVHRNGDVSYAINGHEALRDEGRVIRIKGSHQAETVELGLRLAQQKFGNKLTLTGDDEFKALAVRTAVDQRIKVTFIDPQWEAYRREYVAAKEQQTLAMREAQQETRLQAAAPVERVTFDVPYAERQAATDMGLRFDMATKGLAAERGSQAALEAAARWPEKRTAEVPKEGEEAVREPLVSSPSMPAPDAPKAEASPEVADRGESLQAITDYIEQRNATAQKVSGLPPHRLVREGEEVRGTLEGVRNVGADKVALVAQDRPDAGKEIVVVPMAKNDTSIQSKHKGSRVEGRYERDRAFQVRTLSKGRGITR